MSIIIAALTVVGAVVVITAGIAIIVSLPGLMRYMRIRRM